MAVIEKEAFRGLSVRVGAEGGLRTRDLQISYPSDPFFVQEDYESGAHSGTGNLTRLGYLSSNS